MLNKTNHKPILYNDDNEESPIHVYYSENLLRKPTTQGEIIKNIQYADENNNLKNIINNKNKEIDSNLVEIETHKNTIEKLHKNIEDLNDHLSQVREDYRLLKEKIKKEKVK